ncbi:aminoglycoside phosphotransferase family protein [Ensifer sp. MJa1]
MLPARLTVRHTKGGLDCIEAVSRGEDAHGLSNNPADLQSGLTAAARAIAILHGRTSSVRKIDETWFQDWVERPTAQLRLLNGALLSRSRREQALDLFVARQRSYWLGRKLPLGWCHGDLRPHNLRFIRSSGAVGLAGILEWGNARSDAPAGYDACGLAIALRMGGSAEPVGAIVADLLWLPQWHEGEKTWFAGAAGNELDWSKDAAATAAMVGLVWLHQASGRIGHIEGAGRLWAASNVDRVLRIVSSSKGAN